MSLTPHDLALASQRAYQDSTFERNGVEVLVEQTVDHLLIAFRGTAFDHWDILTDLGVKPWDTIKGVLAMRLPASDLLRDLRAVPIPSLQFGWVHAGFLRGARGVWPELNPRILAARDEGLTIYLTGHSLGGALATVTAAIATVEFRHPVGVLVTFGCPRVGWCGTLGNVLLGTQQERFVKGRDVVTESPPAWTGYQHTCRRSRIGCMGDAFGDHRIAGYIEELSRPA